MIELTKPIRRKTKILLDNRIEARPKDQIIVSLYPTGQIGFRQLRARREYRVDLATVYRFAVREIEYAEAKAKPKRKSRKIKRGLLAAERGN